MELLKLIALDEEDLAVVSTHVQDAIVKVSDIIWQPQDRRLVIALNRFDWEAAQDGAQRYQRRLTALRFDRVNACKCRSVVPADKDAVLNLLAVEFLEGDLPGGAALRLEVECLEVELADLGPAWATAACPAHQDKTQLA